MTVVEVPKVPCALCLRGGEPMETAIDCANKPEPVVEVSEVTPPVEDDLDRVEPALKYPIGTHVWFYFTDKWPEQVIREGEVQGYASGTYQINEVKRGRAIICFVSEQRVFLTRESAIATAVRFEYLALTTTKE